MSDESWYVQELIDNLRVTHRISPDMTFDEALAEFSKFSSVSRDVLADVSLHVPSFNDGSRRKNLIFNIPSGSVVVSTSSEELVLSTPLSAVFAPATRSKISFH